MKGDDEFEDDAGVVKKRGRRYAQTYGRAAKPAGKRAANRGTRRKKPTHKMW